MKRKLLGIALGLTALACAVFAVGGPPTRVIGNGFYTNGIVVSQTPLKLYAVTGYNSTASTAYLMVFETNAVPANGSICRLGPFPVGAGQWYSVDMSFYGADLDKCWVGMSSTAQSLTLAGTNFTFQGITANQGQ